MRHAQWLMWLHLGAAFMAVGALASLWMTGLTNAYQVGWESTFLSADQVHTVLNTLFAPVHWLTGQGTWGIEEIRSLLDLSDDPARDCSEADRIASRHLAQVEEKIAQLTLLRDELTRIVGRCRGGVAADCRVIEALGDHRHCESAH